MPAEAPQPVGGGFVTRPGVFSADGPDAGSQALAAALPKGLKGRAADLGAGWGYLARALAGQAGITQLHLVEAEHAALECARLNVTDPRAAFHWADATRFEAEPFDVIVSNPPFHTSRQADPGLGRAFIAAAARLLKPSGRYVMVANRHLPYEAELQARFRSLETLAEDQRFKVVEARHPRRERR